MVAMGLILVSLLGLLEVASIATLNNMKNQLRDEAVLVGEEQMADLMRRPESGLPAFETISSAVRTRGVGKRYIITRSSEQVAPTSSYKLTVRVGWNYKNVPYNHEVQVMRTFTDGK